jgi:RNA polymerase sigma-70 factor (ECF subfamily)
MSEPDPIGEIYRTEWPRLVAALARRFGDLDIAEEAAGEAFLAAAERWPGALPPNPGGWLMTTATRRALDRVRRDARRQQKYAAAVAIGTAHTDTDSVGDEMSERTDQGPIQDDRLRLMFTCCHPALAREAQVALTLRLVGGLTVAEISRGLLQTEAAVGQRITRAKAKIASAHIPYRVPAEEDLPERLDVVLAVLYLVFNEGYLPGGEAPQRQDLTVEALRLTRLLCELLPSADEASGLLALMLLTDARRATRVAADGVLVTLKDQDRGRWDRRQIHEGLDLIRRLIGDGQPAGPYQLQAAIAAVHMSADELRDTDWPQLGTLYDDLFRLNPSPVVALNRAVVRAELDGPAVALAEVERLELREYHAWHVTRAELLSRLGRSSDARDAYAEAIRLASNSAEIQYLRRRLAAHED